MLVDLSQAVANDAFSVCGILCWELHADAGEQGFVTAGMVELRVGEKCQQSVAETLGCVCMCGRLGEVLHFMRVVVQVVQAFILGLSGPFPPCVADHVTELVVAGDFREDGIVNAVGFAADDGQD